MKADIRVENHGTIFLLWPQNTAAEQWLVDNTDPENRQWWAGTALVVEPRYVETLVNGAREAGLEVG